MQSGLVLLLIVLLLIYLFIEMAVLGCRLVNPPFQTRQIFKLPEGESIMTKPVTVPLGVQAVLSVGHLPKISTQERCSSSHEQKKQHVACFIKRGYSASCVDKA